MIILLSVGAVFVTMAAIGSMIAGPPAAIVAGIVGVIGILTTIVVIARLLSMGRLNEGTQLRLIVTALHRRRHRNFATPDVAPQRDGAHRSFPDANTVYRNF